MISLHQFNRITNSRSRCRPYGLKYMDESENWDPVNEFERHGTKGVNIFILLLSRMSQQYL